VTSILVTGVSTGIGHACANLFAERDWKVIGTVRDTSRRPDRLVSGVSLEELDLAIPGSATDLAQRLLDGAGCPDVLLNNAGALQFGALENVSDADLESIYRVNLFGQLELIRAFLPAMRERRAGVIANVSSLGGTITFPFFGAYNSTKWALEGASEGLWHELKPFGIRVKAIEPGYVDTAIWGKALHRDGAATGPEQAQADDSPYAPFMQAMRQFESGITNRTTPEACAEEIMKAIEDRSDRLRYPVAAYARPIVSARRAFGSQAMMRFFHRRWMGPNSG